ncbi:TPA: hypothetical protein QDZ84_003478 [Shewanella algae]|uniref:hypothetical protein n=1 Tax=Shewanella TaxID=22 RepID=UPI00142F62E8|nr:MULTISPECIES: hypothetical protein [Shewanella]NJI86945.1 hypothetical protein [Shewanella sp. Iso12]HDS1208439.1 hypothetical protein [Shewanella algae]
MFKKLLNLSVAVLDEVLTDASDEEEEKDRQLRGLTVGQSVYVDGESLTLEEARDKQNRGELYNQYYS